mmetsp:Transcript_36969/g.27333  ORF Transcript_36969/g.27333 Transcript_36969/m.27333 type:complete len:117 (+) Transcript_36969:246-596(+)
MKAVNLDNEEVVSWLCSLPNIRLDTADLFGKTALICAVEKKSVTLARLIILGGKNLALKLNMNAFDYRGRTALIYAMISGNLELLKLILDVDEDQHEVKWRDEIGKDVCDYAVTDL